MKRSKIIIISSFCILLVLIIMYYHRTANNKEELYRATPLVTKKLTQIVTSTGTLQPEDKITVGSLVAGRVVELYVDDNDVVKKGQLLVVLDEGFDDQKIRIASAELNQANSALEYQEKFYKRQKELFLSGQLATDTFEKEERDYIIAQERANAASERLSLEKQLYNNRFITSPDDGIVIARKVDLGQMVTSVLQATELFVIAKDLRYMEAHIDVDEADIGLVKVGQAVRFTVDAFPKREYAAKVKQINYLEQIKESVVTYRVILDVENPDLSLRPGMTTNVEIIVAESDNACAIPNKALRINTTSLQAVAEKLGFEFLPDKEAEKATTADFIWVVEGHSFKQIKIEPGVVTRKFTENLNVLDSKTHIITFVKEPDTVNKLLQQSFRGGGGFGKK